MLSLAIHQTRVFAQFEIVHEPIFGSNIAFVDVLLTYLRFLLPDAPEEIERLSKWAFAERQSFARRVPCSDSTKLFIFRPRCR